LKKISLTVLVYGNEIYDALSKHGAMKNRLLFILTLTTLTVTGQNHFLGVKGGANLSEVYASNFINDRNYATGIALGLTYQYRLKRQFTVGADLFYNQLGFSTNIRFSDELGNPTGTNLISKHNFDYVSMPLKVGINFGKKVYGFSNIGLTPQILINAKTIAPAFDFEGVFFPSETSNVTNKVNKFDLGAFAEIGGGYKLNERLWMFSSFSYYHSFTSFTNTAYYESSTVRHYAMTLQFGLKYALAKN
jgi:hypothetical protein